MTPAETTSKLYAFVMFAVVSALAGVLFAGFVVPFAALGGSTATVVAASLSSLPAELDLPPTAEGTVIYLGNGQPLAELYAEDRKPVPLSQIAPVMKTAQLAIEDHRFYEHGAVDLKGTLRAFARNTAGGSTQGGSTLTQQYVKQVQVAAAAARGDQEAVLEAQAPTYERKIREMRYAIAVEKKYSKDEILERYLNIAYYGYGAYGVEVAARRYFGTTAAQLTLSQAAMIAGIVQNPNIDPWRRPEQALERRNVVLNRMAELGMAQQEEVDLAKAQGFDQNLVRPPNQGCITSAYPFMCQYVEMSLLQNPALGANQEERRNTVMRGGLRIHTKIDPAMMNVAQKELSSRIKPTDPVISTMVMIQPGTGLITAIAQNRYQMGANADAGQTYYNYAVEAALGGAEGYQAGSTFKTFTMANAIERGVSVRTQFVSSTPMEFRNKSFLTCDDGADVRFRFPSQYRVENSTGNYGAIDMYKAAEMSVNTYFIQLEQVAGICQSARMADRLGVKLSNGKKMETEYAWYPSFTLGIAEVSPISVASAYATLAARGKRCDPIIIESIKTRDGRAVPTSNGNCEQVIKPEIADAVNSVLQRVMTNGTGARARIQDGRPQAGKTGTTESNAAVWFAGYTPNLAGVAMIAIDKNPRYKSYWDRRNQSLKGVRLPGGFSLEGSG
ncbi:MAG: transglycosylase domain-containing protein, partial [Actinomycetia bacterium]|nr:transglycosylase domain-containing protein [Actinomycetes bacterium]